MNLPLSFEPFLYDENKFLLNMEDMYPDLNYYNNAAFSDTSYYLPCELKTFTETNKASSFSIVHVNCRGLEQNFGKLQSFIYALPIETSVIATSETWTNTSNERLFQLPGYNFEVVSRKHKHCGGVGLYIHHSLTYKLREDLCTSVPDVFECIFVELDLNKTIIGCVYRPPGNDLSTFVSYFDTLLSKINNEKSPVTSVAIST